MKNFESALISELCRCLKIEKRRTKPYQSQCDGMGERMNRTLGDLVTVNVRDAHAEWARNLGLVLMAYRSSVQES